MTEQEYPEHEKLKAIEEEREVVEAFLKWLLRDTSLEIGIRRWKLTKVEESERDPIMGPPEYLYDHIAPDGPFDLETDLVPTPAKPEEIIARYFGIDHEAFLEEKEQLFHEMRQRQQEA